MSSTSSRLQPSATVEELIAALRQIVTKNDASARSHILTSNRLFDHVSLFDALIRAVSLAKNEDAKNNIISAIENATVVCTEYLPVCAALYPFHDEKQIELLKIDSLDRLVFDLENTGWVLVAPANAEFMKLQSILIVLEKFDQFLEVLDQRIEEGDEKVEQMLLAVAEGFRVLFRTHWVPLLADPFFDVTLSLIERSSGAANVVFVNVIDTTVMEDPAVTIYPSTVLRLLQKLDNSKELRDREHDSLEMDAVIYNVLGTAVRRSPESFRDNDFLVENSALIRSCFERSFQIHEFDSSEKIVLTYYVATLCKVDPRLKEKMEGWDRRRVV